MILLSRSRGPCTAIHPACACALHVHFACATPHRASSQGAFVCQGKGCSRSAQLSPRRCSCCAVAKDKKLLGMGSGQPNRVKSVQISLEKAGDEVKVRCARWDLAAAGAVK